MGEPTNPTPAERAERQALAARIVDAVTNDESILKTIGIGGIISANVVSDVETVVFQLAQEVTQLLASDASEIAYRTARKAWEAAEASARGQSNEPAPDPIPPDVAERFERWWAETGSKNPLVG